MVHILRYLLNTQIRDDIQLESSQRQVQQIYIWHMPTFSIVQHTLHVISCKSITVYENTNRWQMATEFLGLGHADVYVFIYRFEV